jgi:phosphatidylglycerol lysyltransferase
VWRFIELADSHGSRAAFYQLPASSLPLYLDAGLKILKLGEEARVLLPSFTLEGSKRANLRYALKRGERDHLQFEIIPPEHVASILDELELVSQEARSAFRSPLSAAILCSRSRSRWSGKRVNWWHSLP